MSEVLYAHDMGGTYGTIWTPKAIGHFAISITIDGTTLEEVYRTQVKASGVPPPPQVTPMERDQPQKLRQFRASNSAGLRIRSHPTLQSEQVGVIKMDGIISFIDEVRKRKVIFSFGRIIIFIQSFWIFSINRSKMMMVYGYVYPLNPFDSIVYQDLGSFH